MRAAIVRAVGARERMQRLGAESLSDAELVALLLCGRHEGRREAAAAALVSRGLTSLRALKPKAARIGRAEHERIQAALELGRRVSLLALPERQRLLNPASICARMVPRLAHLEHEEFWAVLLSARLEDLGTIRISIGGISHCSLLPREAFTPVLLKSAPAVAFAHNHPSGDPAPSENDMRLQLLLDEGGRALGINVVDHLVVTGRGHYSARHGRLSFAGDPISPLDGPPDDPRLDLLEGEPIAFTEVNRTCRSQ